MRAKGNDGVCVDRRTLLSGGSLLLAGALAAPLGQWASASQGPARGWGGALTIASHGTLPFAGGADVVLRGDRLERLSQLRDVLDGTRPQQIGLKIDDADRVMLDIALAERGVRVAHSSNHALALAYRTGAKA